MTPAFSVRRPATLPFDPDEASTIAPTHPGGAGTRGEEALGGGLIPVHLGARSISLQSVALET
ncbi:hypothetical protein C7441_107167 [Pseudaminobacter salicylatoxidans]|uniref:Uncharacterized protein n=1 Tax=Pseudaminobacter salicylatoxidans TaxID=93369 RepID=A0A316C4T0_PSESE|nr:hypothetical protein C7441_107167 [Pseudaminobacter salicylatoxidans]